MKSGLVVLVGRSNVGKSTLLNTIVGTKISATSFRAQMTRHVIHGVMNRPEGQAIFVDTPGVFKDRSNLLSAKLTNKVKAAIEDIDLIIYVVDPTREVGVEERAVYGMIRHLEIPKLLVINKCDVPERERPYQADYEAWGDEFAEVFHLSALRGSHIKPLQDKVMELLPEGEPLYPADQLTNVDNYFWIAEIIREKVFSVLDKEIPYAITVEVDDVEDKSFDSAQGKEEIVVIKARLLTNQERYKKVVIGRGGRKIKEIGQLARRELEAAINKKIYLELEVEVDRHWVERI